MDDQAGSLAAIWRPHLKPGETIAWSAVTSADLRRAAQSRVRAQAALWGTLCGAIAAFCGYRVYEAMAIGGFGAWFATPMLIAFGLALAIASLFFFLRMRIGPPPEFHYAATSTRLIALDADGALVDEVAASDISGMSLDRDERPTELYISPYRPDDQTPNRTFLIQHIPDLRAVRARIAEIFPEAPI